MVATRLAPDGYLARLGIDTAHLEEALVDLERMEDGASRHSVAARTQIRGARRLIRGALEALAQARCSLAAGADPRPKRPGGSSHRAECR